MTSSEQPPQPAKTAWRWVLLGLAACVFCAAIIGAWAFGAYRFHEGKYDPSIAATELDELHVRTLASRGTLLTRDNLGLFVGVNEFRTADFPSLTYAVDDAIAQAHLFTIELDLIPAANTVLAIQGTPGTRRAAAQLQDLLKAGIKPVDGTSADVTEGLQHLAEISRTGAGNGLLIVSISAHGVENSDEAYVILHDSTIERLRNSALTIAQLNDLMRLSNASKRLLLVDACRESVSSISRAPPTPVGQIFFNALAAAKGQKTVASCSSGQLSYEVPAKGHGIFTYWLLMGLKGAASPDARGFITVGTIQHYLSTKVPDYSSHVAPGTQNPWFSADDGSEEIPLAIPLPH